MSAMAPMDTPRFFRWALPLLILLLIVCGIAVWRATRPTVIAVVPETTAQELWESEHAGAARAAHMFGWHIYWNAPSREDDFPRQTQIVRTAIARGVRGLVLSPDHDVVLINPVQEALEAGIPTVIVGSPLGISPGGKLIFVVNDDEATGRLAAERAASFLKPGDTVAILGLNPNILSSITRANAFEITLAKLVPGIRMEERRDTSVSEGAAEEVAESVVDSEPAPRVLFTLNVNETRSAYQALADTHNEGRIVLIACDQDLDLLHHLRSGGIDSLVAQNTFLMGYSAVVNIHKMLLGEPVAQRTIVPPILITRENVDSPEVQQALEMDWREQP